MHHESPRQELCRLTDMDRATMVAVVDTLEALRYARRKRSTIDRRKQLISATARGRRAFDAAVARLETVEREFVAPLDAAEQRRLNTLLAGSTPPTTPPA